LGGGGGGFDDAHQPQINPKSTIPKCNLKPDPKTCTTTARREFVVNIISHWFVEAANHTCGDFDRGVDELAAAGLTAVASQRVRPPRVGEAAVQLECKLRTVHEVEDRWVRREFDRAGRASRPGAWGLRVIVQSCLQQSLNTLALLRAPQTCDPPTQPARARHTHPKKGTATPAPPW